MGLSFAYIQTPSGILKIVEIITVIICIAITRGSKALFGTTVDAMYFGIGVLMTAVIITTLLLICYVMERYEIQKTIFEMVFNFLMFLFLMIAGCVAVSTAISFYMTSDIKRNSITLGSFCIISSIAYLADTVLAIRLFAK